MNLVPDSLVRAPFPAPARLMAMVLLNAPNTPKVHVARAVGVSEPTALRHWAEAVELADKARAEVEAYQKAKADRVAAVLDVLGR